MALHVYTLEHSFYSLVIPILLYTTVYNYTDVTKNKVAYRNTWLLICIDMYCQQKQYALQVLDLLWEITLV